MQTYSVYLATPHRVTGGGRESTDAFWKLLGLLNPDAVHALCKIPDVSYIPSNVQGRFKTTWFGKGR